MADTPPEPPSPPKTLLEEYETGRNLMYRYGIEIARGEAHRRAEAEMLRYIGRK